MIESISKAVRSYSKGPFLFVWSSFMYLILLLAFFFAALGVVLIYFITLSIFKREFDPQSLSSIALFGIIGLVFVFFAGGLNAALAKAYKSAMWKEKTSLVKFYSYAVEKAPEMFGIELLRNLLWLLVAGPAILLYQYSLQGIQYMEIITGIYVLGVTFIAHMAFTPAFISAGALDSGTYTALKHAFSFWRKKHVYFVFIYALFAFVWVFNFVPFIQLLTLFFAYPVMYTSMIVMMEGSWSKTKSRKNEPEDDNDEPEESEDEVVEEAEEE